MNLASINTIVKRSYTYDEFKTLINNHVAEKSTSGIEQEIKRIDATKLNAHRINRIEKQFTANQELIKCNPKQARDYTWLVLAESWCGDVSQNLPLIGLIAKNNPKINLRIILRDENQEVMDNYLTNNSRSIPKLICFDNRTGEEVFNWGPRPKTIANQVIKIKQENPQIDHEEFVKQIQLLYSKDKGKSLLNDLKEFFENT